MPSPPATAMRGPRVAPAVTMIRAVRARAAMRVRRAAPGPNGAMTARMIAAMPGGPPPGRTGVGRNAAAR